MRVVVLSTARRMNYETFAVRKYLTSYNLTGSVNDPAGINEINADMKRVDVGFLLCQL
jgi:hypothetical protein